MLTKKTLGIIFSNMHDYMVGELTSKRSMGSIPVGGRYRIIDFPLSWMVNAGIRDVGVITKSNYQSLMDHLGSGREWDLARKKGGLSILPPFGSADSSGVYRGRLEALAGIESYIKSNHCKYVVLADCDLIANMDIEAIVNTHIAGDADITVVYNRRAVTQEQVRDTVVFELDGDVVTETRVYPTPDMEHAVYLNVMVIALDRLVELIADSHSRSMFSLVEGVFQAEKGRHRIHGYEHKGPTLRVTNLMDYYQANLALLDPKLQEEIFVRDRPIYTKVRDEPPAKYGLDAKVKNSLVADGCVIEGEVEDSVLFRGVRVNPGVVVKNSILMQNTLVEEGASLDCVITDKDVRIQKERTLAGYKTYPVYIAKGSVI